MIANGISTAEEMDAIESEDKKLVRNLAKDAERLLRPDQAPY